MTDWPSVSPALSCWIGRIGCVLMVVGWGWHGRLVYDALFLRRVCFKHDASLGCFSAEWTGHGLAACWKAQ